MAIAGSLTYDTKIDKSGFEKGINSLTGTAKNAGTKIKSIVTALGIDKLISATFNVLNNSIDGAVSRLDTLNNYPKVMSNLGVATEDAQKSIDKMSDKLSGLPTTLDDAVLSVQRFTSANGDVKKSTDYFLALNNALLAGGTSADIQSSAMEQLSQAYAKGKPDAMEWRSLLTAMPGQLKQVATAMGYTSTAVGGDFYEALQKGEISMDNFMETLVKLNEKGTGEFQSFEEQARNSTDGIGTAINVAKTQVVKGLTEIIKSVNQATKDKGLGSIGEIIANIGKKAKEVLNVVAKNTPKIIQFIENAFKALKNLLPVITAVVAGMVAYKVALVAIKAINIASSIMGTISAFVSLIPMIKSAKDAMLLLNMSMNANPVGLVVAGITALTVVLGYLALRQTEAQKQAKEFSKEMANSRKELDDYNTSIDANKDKSLSQINSVKSLRNELSELVDENGRVKEGYESRVSFILNELNNALGTEYKLNGNIINSYQELEKEIDKLIEKKKAQIIFEAEEEKYKEAIKNQTQAVEDLKTAQENLGMSYEEAKNKLASYDNQMKNLALLDPDPLATAILEAGILKQKKSLETLVQGYEDAEYRVKNYTDEQIKYADMYEKYVNEDYSSIANTIITTTQDWTSQTLNELNNSINQQSNALDQYKDIYKNTGNEIAQQNAEQAQKNLDDLANELISRTKTVGDLGQDEIYAWENLANKSYSTYSTSLAKVSPETKKRIEEATRVISSDTSVENATKNLATEASDGFNNNVNGSKWGNDLISNLSSAISAGKSIVGSAVTGVAGIIKSVLGHSVPKEGPLKDELTYMPDMIDNLVKGIEKNKYKLSNAVQSLSADMEKRLQDVVNLEIGKTNATATVKSNAMYNSVIQINANFDGNVEMDSTRVGRLVAPAISKTLRTAGV